MDIVRVLAKLEPGGAQLSVLRVTQALAAQGVHTSRFLVGEATSEGIALARRFGVAAEVFAEPSGLQWRPSVEFAEWLRPRLRDARAVHANMFGAWWAASHVVPAGVPLAASEHNEMTWPGTDRDTAAALACAGEAAPRVDAFFAHGPAARGFALQVGIPPERLHHGRSPIADEAECRGDRPPEALRPGRLTFTGRLTPDKGPDVLVEALRLLRRPPPAYLVGAGVLRPALQDRVRAYGLDRTVVFTGWSYAPAQYVAAAAVHVVPSREEAWSQSAVTALRLGVPVVGTDVDGLRLTLGEGRGVLVPPADPHALAQALRRVLAGQRPDPEPGRAYAAQFTPSAVAARYGEHYRRLAHQVQLV